MSSSSSSSSSSRRRTAADVFQRNNSFRIEGVPIGPPAVYSDEVRRDVGIGQGDETGSITAEDAHHVTGRVYEREGDGTNHQYQQMYGELSGIRNNLQARSTMARVVEDVGGLRVGLRLRADIRGLAIGELVEELRIKYGEMFLRGLYLYAKVRDVHLTSIQGVEAAERDRVGLTPSSTFNTYIRDTRVKHVPLWRVLPVLPISVDSGGRKHYFTGGTLDEHMEGLKRLFLERLIANESGTPLDTELMGSDVASFFILEEVSIVRRNQVPSYMDTRISPIRTGGFGELLPTTTTFSFTVKDLLDTYSSEVDKSYPNLAVLKRDDKVREFRKMLIDMVFPAEDIHEEIAVALINLVPGRGGEGAVSGGYHQLMNKPHDQHLLTILERQEFVVVVPGGTGCCVDNCITEVMKLALHSYRELPYRDASVEVARNQAKGAYVAERMKSNRNKRNRGGGSVNLDNKFRKDFDERTKNGYSPFFFKLLKNALRSLFRINPRIFYERYEEVPQEGPALPFPSGGVRRRLQEVVSGCTTPKACDLNPHSYLENEAGYLNICMFRINLNGEVHRHYPKSHYTHRGNLKEANATPFITEEEEGGSGLLHAIGIFPYVPYEILKDKLMLHAFFKIIHSKTVPLMMMNRGKSFGSTTVTSEEINTLVKYQRKRHSDSITKTLIYGDGSNNVAAWGLNRFSSVDDRDFEAAVRVEAERQEFEEKPLVVAYDLETVELTQECINSGAVPDKFLKYNPNVAKYEQLERQIPYMVQWVPVNLSDEGSLLERKEALRLFPRTDKPSPHFLTQNDWIHGRGWEEGENSAKKFRKGWIVLDEVKIEYGGNKLGQCIEDFIQNVFTWAVKHGYSSVKCYAHNGASFDTLVLQSYNTIFKIAKILKVKGSILNLRVKIPLQSDKEGGRGKHFYINFGDTRKFLTGSLAQLCKDFKLPLVWSKLDFPIARIDWKICFHPDIKKVVEPYGINDAYALAFIVKQINRMLCLHPKEVVIPGREEFLSCLSGLSSLPPSPFSLKLQEMNIVNIHSMKPPIDQFCTIMSFVKKVLNSHVQFSPDRINYRPAAVDVPALRHWVDMSLAGGRVTAYCKVYASSRLGDILECWMGGDFEGVKRFLKEAMDKKDTEVCLDMTSLYPSAMTHCPLPMGKIHPLSLSECKATIDVIGCVECEERMSLCPKHKLPTPLLRPFSVILVRDMFPTPGAKESLINLVGRKIRPITFKNNKGKPIVNTDSGRKSEGLTYNLETERETTKRMWGDKPDDADSDDWNVYGRVQSYTNVDLYWARKCGFNFEIVAGFGWEMSALMGELYEGLFELRAKAKQEKNHSLQLALKNVLNGGYGVHCQKIINSAEKVVDMPQDIYDCDIRDVRVMQFLRDHHHDAFDSRFVLKENIPLTNKQSFIRAKMPTDLGEVVGGSSPNQIGSAVVAWSRHLMNLVMFPLMQQKDGAVTYTDTDSLTITQEMYDFMVEKKPHLMDPSGKTLSTFKNDHADIFPNGRIVFSALGGKKVKMHIVACPDTGNLKICNTYKGFITADSDEEGRKYTKDRAGFTISSSLIDILYDGRPDAHKGTRWTRSLGDGGVRIEKGVDFESNSKAYLGHCAGYAAVYPPNPFFGPTKDPNERPALMVACIPHGSIRNFQLGTPVFFPSSGRGGKEEMTMSGGWRDFLDNNLDAHPTKRRVTRESLGAFFAKYFSQKDGYYGEYTVSPFARKEGESGENFELREKERKRKFEREFSEWTDINSLIDGVNSSVVVVEGRRPPSPSPSPHPIPTTPLPLPPLPLLTPFPPLFHPSSSPSTPLPLPSLPPLPPPFVPPPLTYPSMDEGGEDFDFSLSPLPEDNFDPFLEGGVPVDGGGEMIFFSQEEEDIFGGLSDFEGDK